jgi:hypothetical protein
MVTVAATMSEDIPRFWAMLEYISRNSLGLALADASEVTQSARDVRLDQRQVEYTKGKHGCEPAPQAPPKLAMTTLA